MAKLKREKRRNKIYPTDTPCQNERYFSPKTDKRKEAKEFVSEESSNGFKRLDLSESVEGSSRKGKAKTKSPFNETEETDIKKHAYDTYQEDDSTEESRENKSFSDES